MAHTSHPATRCGIGPSHAWRCTRAGHPGQIVYCQSVALDRIGQGFDIVIGVIDYSVAPRQIRWTR